MTLMPAAFISCMYGSGLRPAVSTIRTPPSMIARMYSGYGGLANVGRKVRFTPNGLSVMSRQRAISGPSRSGVCWVRPVITGAQAAGVGHRGGQLREADKVHAALDDRVLDAEQFSDASLHGATPENAARVVQALRDFGFGELQVNASDFTQPDRILQLGRPPNRIDILTSISGVEFEQAWLNRVQGKLGRRTVSFLGWDELILNKKACGRDKDKLDVATLEAIAARR
jgi:hypothetical protein